MDVRATSAGVGGDPASHLDSALALARRLGAAALATLGILVLLPAIAAQAALAF